MSCARDRPMKTGDVRFLVKAMSYKQDPSFVHVSTISFARSFRSVRHLLLIVNDLAHF